MDNRLFKRINHIAATAILVVASIVYLCTIEPTASFWDCGEFIASSYKLEVGHPPGNPVFQLFARIFTIFTGAEHAAIAVNCFSALCSAFTIFFLYLTIVHFGRRILSKSREEMTLGNVVALIGSGVAGSLAYCFSDTFWFSAVEGEVYAMSSLFTAIVFWAILKWEEDDSKYANRWLVLISFLTGLSIGVHLLNLLVIPAIVFIIYYKKYENTKLSFGKQFVILALSGVIIGFLLFFLIPYTPKILGFVDRIFVNGMGAPYNIGAAIFLLIMFALSFWGLKILREREKVFAHTALLSLLTIMIGYSTFAVVIIRASANTPTNEYSPDNPYTLVRYIGREQYGSNPLIYGEAYTSVLEVKQDTYYTPLNGKYVETPAPLEAVYPAGAKMFFPRMWSTQSESHQSFYDSYTNGDFRTRKIKMSNGETKVCRMPKFSDNLRFFFDYQVGYMYLRYFMWNFVGRQNDLHGQIPGDLTSGNWESGIGFLDRARLGDQSIAPDYIKNNKAKNHYYFLPLLLGILGLAFQYSKDKRNCWITFLLFILTGLAIIIYLNQPPYQVRERDYAYAGSFYVFTIWIGLAVMALKVAFDKFVNRPVASASIASVLAISVAILMGCENWDDHDRSGRTTSRDLAHNYLVGLGPQAIIITHGDNDTFTLWYAQEVEGIRTDVRIMNTSLLGMDWYIDQMKCKVYESEPLPISLPREDYLFGTNDFVPVYDVLKKPVPVSDVINIFRDERYREGKSGIIAANKILVPVYKENALASGIVNAKDADKILDYIQLEISGSTLSKTDLIILDILSNYDWKRPIYFVSQQGDCDFNLAKYLQFDGLAYKLVPLICPQEGVKQMDVDKMKDLLMTKYEFDSNRDTTVFVDYQNCYSFTSVMPIREMFVNTAEALIEQKRYDEAVELMDRCYEVTPNANYPYNVSVFGGINELLVINSIEIYLALGEKEKAFKLYDEFFKQTQSALIYFTQNIGGYVLDESQAKRNANYLYYLGSLMTKYGYPEKDEEINKFIDEL